MGTFVSLTRLAQQAVAAAIEPGCMAIDATVGNGHDTLFLARHVAPTGHVIGFDIQPRALQGARDRLDETGLAPLATLHLQGHENMLELVPPDWSGEVAAVMFNLGYLPGGDKTRTTSATNTVNALDQALSLLRVDGLISVLVYRGHAGARIEADAVTAWLDRLAPQHEIKRHDSPGPVLYLIKRIS